MAILACITCGGDTQATCDCCKCHCANPNPQQSRPDLEPSNIIKLQERLGIPTDRKERKERPIARGVLDYFPDAMAEIAHVSFVGNEQHNPGQPMHWSKNLSDDHADALVRHLLQRGGVDTDGLSHTAKVAWRALALLQTEIEQKRTTK
jgi:hypothetical protein